MINITYINIYIFILEKSTALNPKEFCEKRKIRRKKLPTPEMLKTEQDKNASDSRPIVVHGQTSGHGNFDLNKKLDEE